MADDKKKKKKKKSTTTKNDNAVDIELNKIKHGDFAKPKPKPKPKPPACDMDALKSIADMVMSTDKKQVTVWDWNSDYAKLAEDGYIRAVQRNLGFRVWITPKGYAELDKEKR